MVELLLDRKAMRALLAGLALAAALSFAAGMVLGLQRSLPAAESVAAASARTRAAAPATEASASETLPAGPGPTAPADPAVGEPSMLREASETSAAATRAAAPTSVDRAAALPVTSHAGLPPSAVAAPAGPAAAPASHGRATVRQPVRPRSPDVRSVRPVAAAPAERTGSGSFTVQAGAYAVPDNAAHQIATLEARGYPARFVQRTDASGRRLTLVLVGHFRDRAAAARTVAALGTEGIAAFARLDV